MNFLYSEWDIFRGKLTVLIGLMYIFAVKNYSVCQKLGIRKARSFLGVDKVAPNSLGELPMNRQLAEVSQ